MSQIRWRRPQIKLAALFILALGVGIGLVFREYASFFSRIPSTSPKATQFVYTGGLFGIPQKK